MADTRKKQPTVGVTQGTNGQALPTYGGVDVSGANTLPAKTFGAPSGTVATSSPTTAGWDSSINRPVYALGAEGSTATKGIVAPLQGTPIKGVSPTANPSAGGAGGAVAGVVALANLPTDKEEEKKKSGGGGKGGAVLPSVPAQLANQIADAYSRSQAALPGAYDNKYQAQIEALRGQRYGDYESQYLPQIDNLVDRLLNRDSFSYNWSDDPLYRQYAARYQQAARQGMQDTMGQAAALTGGYGNSYATAAANQAYANTMAGLNDRAMDLYQLAAENYDRDTNNLRSNLQQLEQREAANRSYYDTDRDVFYNRQDADLNNLYNQQAMDYQMWQDALARDQYEKELAWQQYQYWNNLAHSKYKYY